LFYTDGDYIFYSINAQHFLIHIFSNFMGHFGLIVNLWYLLT
jgi:hypothetical protein